MLVGKLLEPLWGAFEMLIFFGAVNLGVAVLSSFFYYVLYMLTFNTQLLFEVHIHGQGIDHSLSTKARAFPDISSSPPIKILFKVALIITCYCADWQPNSANLSFEVERNRRNKGEEI